MTCTTLTHNFICQLHESLGIIVWHIFLFVDEFTTKLLGQIQLPKQILTKLLVLFPKKVSKYVKEGILYGLWLGLW